ncbi:polysaccharide biosynthesis/export family protein [Caulobacter sp. CCNWLY153]|uniref:polysaccharide biosynthesis/export family protein n=1 Tax=unclassified Caulobacter TaxID=2648921 RepID=UPI002FEFD86A
MTSLAGSFRKLAVLAGAPLLLTACGALPTSGPTASVILAATRDTPDFRLVMLDAKALADLRAAESEARAFADLPPARDVERIAPGDVLDIVVFEVGVSLFSGRSTAAFDLDAARAAGEALPPTVVDRSGAVSLPYVGRTLATGLTPAELGARIEAGLARKSQAPQVVVRIRESVAGGVMVTGDVRKPGRYPLTLAGERLLDAVALAGGSVASRQDSLVRLVRGGAIAAGPLSEILLGSSADAPLSPGDRVEVTARVRTFTAFGAAGKVAEIPFESDRVSLAQALARAGGPNDQQADPRAVFVFRQGADGKPTAYQVDLMKPQGYFLAQGFDMRAGDVLYVANAESNDKTKFIQILNLFFSPVYTAKVLAQ